ncbi:MAG: ScyD/ScyE family protein [Betaproteobacteria bacterium]|nr:ScyD/ScyE family protein [Betaproteobacteria bacterium]
MLTTSATRFRSCVDTRHRNLVLISAALALSTVLVSGTLEAAEYIASVFASELHNPRGLAFSSDGALYIAEAGIPGGPGPSTPIRGIENVYTESGSVTRVSGGIQTRVTMGLPSLYSTETGETSGPNDVTFDANGNLHVTIGAGVDPAVRSTDLAPNGIGLGTIRFSGGTYDVANHEALNNPAGGPVDSNPWRTVAHAGGLLVTDAGANTLLNVAPDGTISTITTFPGRDTGGGFPSDAVPTGLAVGPDGNFYVGQLTGFPFVPGSAQIFAVQPDGTTTVAATGFTHISALAFGGDGSLFVLEYDSNGLFVPGDSGALIRIDPNGQRETIFSDGLVNPTGLAVGPDGALYVSSVGNSGSQGKVLRIAPVPEPETYALVLGGLTLVGLAAGRKKRQRSSHAHPQPIPARRGSFHRA